MEGKACLNEVKRISPIPKLVGGKQLAEHRAIDPRPCRSGALRQGDPCAPCRKGIGCTVKAQQRFGEVKPVIHPLWPFGGTANQQGNIAMMLGGEVALIT
jgi:hypothetical protein